MGALSAEKTLRRLIALPPTLHGAIHMPWVQRTADVRFRWVAKSIVHSGLADRALVQLSYAIGVSEPLSVFVDTYGTGKIPNERILELVQKVRGSTCEGGVGSCAHLCLSRCAEL